MRHRRALAWWISYFRSGTVMRHRRALACLCRRSHPAIPDQHDRRRRLRLRVHREERLVGLRRRAQLGGAVLGVGARRSQLDDGDPRHAAGGGGGAAAAGGHSAAAGAAAGGGGGAGGGGRRGGGATAGGRARRVGALGARGREGGGDGDTEAGAPAERRRVLDPAGVPVSGDGPARRRRRRRRRRSSRCTAGTWCGGRRG